jgi:polysaccharide pyruvyl transferase WcaK-like protein/glycosyltransferase involved in cell wall biosynthesis
VNVTVVVVAYNEERKIGGCLRSIAAQDYRGGEVEILLVDGGSTDRTAEIARATVPSVRIVPNPGGSISSNRNCGWRAARDPFVAFLDADCEAPPHWLRTLAEGLAGPAGETAAAVGGANVPPPAASPFYEALAVMLDTWAGSRGSLQGRVYREAREVEHLPGLNVLFRRAVLEAVAGWDEHFGFIGEDEDLSHRLRGQGFRLLYVPGAAVVHRQRGDLRSWARNMFLYGKGRVWLIRRHPRTFQLSFLLPPLLPLLLWAYLPVVLLAALWHGLRAGKPGVIPRLVLLFATTHLAYGLGEWAGLFTTGDSPQARESARWPKVGLIVLKNAGNKGDEAILVSVCRRWLLRQREEPLRCHLYALGFGPSGCDVRLVPGDLAGVERLAGDLCRAHPGSRRLGAQALGHGVTLLYVLLTFRAVLFCGGQWIHDLRPAFHAAISGLLTVARLAGTRAGVFCVGSGPLRAAWSRLAVRLAFGRRALIVVRDPASEALYRKMGFPQVKLAVDPALELPAAPQVSSPLGGGRLEQGGGQEGGGSMMRKPSTVGLSPCAWFRFENVYRRDPAVIEDMVAALLRLVEGLRRRGVRVLLIPTMNPEDRRISERLAAASPSGEPAVERLETEALTPSQIQGAIGSLDALISMRLHPAIFALNAGTPFVALDYAQKVAEFCRRAGLGDRLVALDGDWGEEALRRLDDFDGEALGRRMAEAHARLAAELESAYEALWAWLAGSCDDPLPGYGPTPHDRA